MSRVNVRNSIYRISGACLKMCHHLVQYFDRNMFDKTGKLSEI